MKRSFFFPLMLALLFIMGGCSTVGTFKLPPNTTLRVNNRSVQLNEKNEWETSPFFWSSTGGAKYWLYDNNHNVIKKGKIKTRFRVVSIFWPPFAIIYWPMELVKNEVYDFTNKPDGELIINDEMSN